MGNAIVESKTQLVRNAVNTDSNEVDRLYPESIDKTTESASGKMDTAYMDKSSS